ncbi:MAG: HAMP domain-containing protein [Leptolyngbya sp. LCM1.Bin17]|nr:MAG: HAMP domain-containing protein [Leptolyngbya sp. LCM1.Bin17]
MKISLRALLIVPFLLQVVGITGLVVYLSYRSNQQTVVAMTEHMVAETADRITQQLADYFQAPVALAHQHQAAITSGLVDWQDMAAVEAYFVHQIVYHPNVSGIMITTEDKHFLAVGRPETGQLLIRRRNLNTGELQSIIADQAGTPLAVKEVLPNYDPHQTPPEQPWYELAKANPDGLWLPTVSLARGIEQPILMMAYFLPFTDPQDRPQGVLSASIYLDQAGDFLRRLTIGQTGQAFIVDAQGHLLATSGAEVPFQRSQPQQPLSLKPQDWLLKVQTSQDPVTRMAAQLGVSATLPQATTPFKFRLNGTRYSGKAVPFTPNDQLQWQVVVVISESDFTAAATSGLIRTLLLGGLALLGSIGFGIWTAEYIAKPILSLQQATQAVTGGLAVVPPTQATPILEVEALRQCFDQMTSQLVASFQALRDRETTLASFLNRMPVAISVHDPTGQVLFLNQKGKQLLVQHSPQTMSETSADQLAEIYQLYVAGTDQLYPTDQLPVVRGLRGESAYADDIEIDTGRQRLPLEIHTIPVFDAAGQVVYSINAFQDITERRRAEQLQANYERELEQQVAKQMASLAENEITKQALINAMPDLLMRLGREGIPLEIYNLDAVHWLGDKSQIFHKTMYDNLPQAVAEERRRHVERALATGMIQRQEYELEVNGQIYSEEARIVPVTQDEVLMVVRDISDRRKVERLKDEFISIVSHELRTPLTAIRGALGILDTDVLRDRPDKAHYMLQMALANTERLIRLVNDILDVERLTSGKVSPVREPCPVNHLAQLAVNGVETLALSAHISLKVDVPAVTLWADPDAIIQALTNLLSNAIKFSDPGSRVWLKAEVTGEGIKPAAVKGAPDNPSEPYLVFSVADQGRGIPADRLELIFERFLQVDASDSREKGGTGLGLAICKRIVDNHGGDIWVESVLGEGSTFYIALPMHPSRTEES